MKKKIEKYKKPSPPKKTKNNKIKRKNYKTIKKPKQKNCIRM